MTFIRAHRNWLIMLFLATAILVGRTPALHYAGDQVATNLAELKTSRAKIEQALQQLQDDVAAAQKLGSQMDLNRAAQVLAPTDRLKAASMLEKEATNFHISKFTYTLAPEERVSMGSIGSSQMLSVSNIALAGDAPTDATIYNFIEQIRPQLAGRARIQQMTLTRLGGPEAPLAPNNIHFEVTLEWLSNGAVQTVAGGL